MNAPTCTSLAPGGEDPVSGIWNTAAETMSRASLRALQDERLRQQFERVFERSPLQGERLRAAGLSPARFDGLTDLAAVPTFSKDDLRAWRIATRDPFGGARSADQSELAVITHSSGTSGDPTISGLTEADVEVMGELFARALYSIGLRPADRAPLAATVLWHGAVIGYELAHRVIGAQTYRIACGTADGAKTVLEQWGDADFTVLRSYIPELEIPFLEESGLKPNELFPNARFLYAGIDLSGPKRQLIEDTWGMPFRNTFASGDQYLVGGECSHSAPFHHIAEDSVLYEIVDPETGEPLPPGSVGELVVTNLWAEGCPYLRYRLEDMAMLLDARCACGRTSARIRVLGRAAWSVLVGSLRIFSTEVEEALWTEPTLAGVSYQLVRRSAQPQEALRVRLDRDLGGDADLGDVAALLERKLGVPAEAEWAPTSIALSGPIKIERIVTVE